MLLSVKQCLIIFEGEKVPPIVISLSYWNVSRLTLLYVQSEAAAGRGGVVSPAYSVDSTVTVSTVSSSTATEKSVRFSDRDHILSTPGECWLSRITLFDLNVTPCSEPSCWPPHPSASPPVCPPSARVKSILKPEQSPGLYKQSPASSPGLYKGSPASIPDVTSFFLDKDEGTLV